MSTSTVQEFANEVNLFFFNEVRKNGNNIVCGDTCTTLNARQHNLFKRGHKTIKDGHRMFHDLQTASTRSMDYAFRIWTFDVLL